MSTGDDYILGGGEKTLVPFLATMEVLAPLKNDPFMWGRLIQSFSHLEIKNLSIISNLIDRARMVKQFQIGSIRSRSTLLLGDPQLIKDNYCHISQIEL